MRESLTNVLVNDNETVDSVPGILNMTESDFGILRRSNSSNTWQRSWPHVVIRESNSVNAVANT
jgi:hypothetical protein